MVENATQINNIDLAAHADNTAAYIHELSLAASGSTPSLSPGDSGRISSYIAALQNELSVISGRPALDLPHFDPKMITLNPVPESAEFENPFITYLDVLFRAYYTEIVNSTSARTVSSISTVDQARLLALTEAMTTYMTDFVANQNPLDMPESSGSTGK